MIDKFLAGIWFVLSVIDFIFGNYHISFLEFVIFYYNMQNVYDSE